MDPMPTNRGVMTWLCAYPAPKSTNKWINLAHITFTVAVCVVVVGCMIASTVFFIEHVRIDLEITLFAVLQMNSAIGFFYIIITSIVQRYRIKDIFESLKNIYKASEKENWFHFVDEMNQKSEWIWKMYAIFGMGGFALNDVMMSGTSIFYCWMTYGTFDTKHLYTSYKFTLPWNQTTKFGYFIQIIFDILVGESNFLSSGLVLLLFISICLHHMAFYNRFKHSISKLGDVTLGDRANDKKLLCDLIQFQNLAKHWFLETTNVYSALILVQLMSNMLFLAIVVFHLDLQIKHIDLSALIIVTAALVGASNLLCYCYFGTLATKSYESMADCVFESNWLELQLDLKKYLIVMMANAQRPIYYHGFGFVYLRMQTFTSLIKTVFNYYMMFKTLTKKH